MTLKLRGTRTLIGVVAVVGLLAAGSSNPPEAEAFAPANKGAVVNYLHSITGSKVVSGQHNKEPAAQPGYYTQRVHDITGVYPGLWGGDFLFGANDVANRQSVVNQARTEWQNGSLVVLSWHVCPPTGASTCTWEQINGDLTDWQWSQLITNGTALNTAWKSRLDEIVPSLQQLEDAGVPAIFRPLHEMNETWPWWGGRSGTDGSSRLYQITHDYLVQAKGLNNLVWAWNVQDNPNGNLAGYYPGAGYTDVVTLDAWYKDFPSQGEYAALQNIAAGKPIALGEIGRMPSEWQLASQPNWSYFMHWSEQLESQNSHQAIKDTYYNPRVLHQGDLTIP